MIVAGVSATPRRHLSWLYRMPTVVSSAQITSHAFQLDAKMSRRITRNTKLDSILSSEWYTRHVLGRARSGDKDERTNKREKKKGEY
jgi:hypothetical protein